MRKEKRALRLQYMTIVINFCDFVADPILVLFGFVVFVVVVGYFFSPQCSSVD